MADKVISLPATTKYVRHRDIWDLAWLQQQGAQLNINLVRNKIADYQLDAYETMLSNLIERLPALVYSSEFIDEMKRFLPTDVFERTIAQEKFQIYLRNTLLKLFRSVEIQLNGNTPAPDFVM